MTQTIDRYPSPVVTPTVSELRDAVMSLNYLGAFMTAGHHDAGKTELMTEKRIFQPTQNSAERLVSALETCSASDSQSGQENPELSLISPAFIIQRTVRAAESIRRQLSPDVLEMSDSVPLGEVASTKAGLQRDRALARVALQGLDPSVAKDRLRRAEVHGDHDELTPLSSRREYHEITAETVSALGSEKPGRFVQLVADTLSPIRNEHAPLAPEVLTQVADTIATRREELGSYAEVLFTNAWRLALQAGRTDIAEHIKSLLGNDSVLGKYMDAYELPTEATPNIEKQAENVERLTGEYSAAGHDPARLPEIQPDSLPKRRTRIKPEALWSIAMRDGGYLRSAQEGAMRGSTRSYQGNYSMIRQEIERTLFGDAAVDTVVTEPILYGYYAPEKVKQTVAMQSLSRIYGAIELVFKDDAPVETRAIYGDSVNAVSVMAADQGLRDVTKDFVKEVVESRIIPVAEAGRMAEVIAALHGNELNDEHNVSADPYVECVMRGRLNLGDCESIIVPAHIYDKNPELTQQISEIYGTSIVRVNPDDTRS